MAESPRAGFAAASGERRAPDADSEAWLTALGAGGAVRADAVARLQALLLRAARFEVARRRRALSHLRGDQLEDIALEAADDATVAVLAHLGDYLGLSKFTTWAYKFALLEAAVKLRRRAWQAREIPLEPETWSLISAGGQSPEDEVEQRELIAALQEAIATSLTPHQRRVLVALALNGVPIDVLAQRLGTSRGALYKTLHDARRRLRGRLGELGLRPGLPSEESR